VAPAKTGCEPLLKKLLIQPETSSIFASITSAAAGAGGGAATFSCFFDGCFIVSCFIIKGGLCSRVDARFSKVFLGGLVLWP